MAQYTFSAIGLNDLTVSGPDPFSSGATRETAAFNTTTFTVSPSVTWVDLTLEDNEDHLNDGDASQDLVGGVTFNGTSFPAGYEVETEYSYYVRPVGSTDPSEWFTIYVLEFSGDVHGIAADSRMAPGQTYEILTGGSDDPSVLYADLVVCFTPGTGIATPRGPVPVEALQVGDMVDTVDNGPQPIAWIGRQVARGRGGAAPVRVEAGMLGNARDIYLSQQHRVLIRPGMGVHLPGNDEVLLPIKGLIGQPGFRVVPHVRVHYYHLLFERHEVIWADGCMVESMFPGPQAIKSLSRAERAELFLRFPSLRQRRRWAPARDFLSPGRWARMLEGQGVCLHPG